MKVLPKSSSDEKVLTIEKDQEKKGYEDAIGAILAADEKLQNEANHGVRRSALSERRIDRGLLCALGLIIILCGVGMITSIGGALYLKFRNQPNKTIATSATLHATPAPHFQLQPPAIATMAPPEDNQIDGNDLHKSLFRIRMKVIPSDEEGDGLFGPELVPPTVDPFEETLWKQIRLQYASNGSNNDKDEKRNQLSSGSPSTQPPTDYIPVNKHRDLQDPPTFSDFVKFIRRVFHIPSIRLVREP